MWDTTVCAAERKARLGFSRWDQARSDAVFFVDFQPSLNVFSTTSNLISLENAKTQENGLAWSHRENPDRASISTMYFGSCAS
ncbi:hypothetical protein L596_004247 [Steinernema carpocapsae]|uniref:Uncharacterized protein n=1 Tax=Steinernema carpocapsae TaxID=34508 RepID=A0A4U8UVB9_STECR|nr:hypothetical protein L596_004247 [Steinernema carpocapsae]